MPNDCPMKALVVQPQSMIRVLSNTISNAPVIAHSQSLVTVDVPVNLELLCPLCRYPGPQARLGSQHRGLSYPPSLKTASPSMIANSQSTAQTAPHDIKISRPNHSKIGPTRTNVGGIRLAERNGVRTFKPIQFFGKFSRLYGEFAWQDIG